MKKILIIYDYATVRELLAEELAADGHLVVPIDKLGLAKELIGTLKPDLVLLNVHRNGKEHWEVLEEIKKDDPSLPVLVLSTYFTGPQNLHDKLIDVYEMNSFRFDGLRKKVAQIFQQQGGKTRKNERKNIQKPQINRLDYQHSPLGIIQHGMGCERGR